MYDYRYFIGLIGLATAVLAGCAHAPREQTVTYGCDGGRHIVVTYRGADRAIVQMGPRQLDMRAADSPIGYRYVGQRLQWVVRTTHEPPTATLFTRGYDGEPGEIAERCIETGRD